MLLLKMSLAALQWFIIIKDLVYSHRVSQNLSLYANKLKIDRSWKAMSDSEICRSANLTKLHKSSHVEEFYCTLRTPKCLKSFCQIMSQFQSRLWMFMLYGNLKQTENVNFLLNFSKISRFILNFLQ